MSSAPPLPAPRGIAMPVKIFVAAIGIFALVQIFWWRGAAGSRWEMKDLALVAEIGGPAPELGGLIQPLGVAVNDAGEIFVADAGNYTDPTTAKIVKYSADGKLAGDFKLTDGALPLALHNVIGVAVSSDGELTALDGDPHGSKFVRFARDGKVRVVQNVGMYGAYTINADIEGHVWVGSLWGAATYDREGKDDFWAGKAAKAGVNGAEKGELSGPSAAVRARNGSFFVADRGNWRIQKFDRKGAFTTMWSVPRDDLKLGGIMRALALDAKGKVYCAAENGGSLWVFSDGLRPAALVKKIGTQPLANPMGLTCDKQGAMYVADAGLHKILKFSPL